MLFLPADPLPRNWSLGLVMQRWVVLFENIPVAGWFEWEPKGDLKTNLGGGSPKWMGSSGSPGRASTNRCPFGDPKFQAAGRTMTC